MARPRGENVHECAWLISGKGENPKRNAGRFTDTNVKPIPSLILQVHRICNQPNKRRMKTCPQCKLENDDEAGNCRGCGAELRILKDESFSRRTKLLLWIAAWGGVIFAVLAINPAYIRAAFLFPIGLFAFLANGTQNAFWAWVAGGFIIGWMLYAVLSAMMFGAKNKQFFIVIYVIFCILLALNVGGCVKVLEDASHIQ